MSLYFYPTSITFPIGHFAKTALDNLPNRFAEKGLKADWVIKGPFHDEESGEYAFVIHGGPSKVQEIFSIKESEFMFDSRAAENFISKLVSYCMEAEFSKGVMDVLRGKESALKKEGDPAEPETVKVFVMGRNKEAVATEVKIGAEKKEEKGKIVIATR